MKTENAIRLDLTRLYGFKILQGANVDPVWRNEQPAKLTCHVGTKMGTKTKAGAKLGLKLGLKVGAKIGLKG